MKSRLIDEQGARTWIVIFETGDEVVEGLRRFADQNSLGGSSFKAIGAFSEVRVGWFNWETKKYETAADFHEQVEVLSLIGDIALKNGQPEVHAHIVVGRRDGTAHGGHLLEGRVRPTLEVVLTQSAQDLVKTIDPQSGLALINP